MVRLRVRVLGSPPALVANTEGLEFGFGLGVRLGLGLGIGLG